MDELAEFLTENTDRNILALALDNLLGVSGSASGISSIVQSEAVLKCLWNLSSRKSALLCMVNISADEKAAEKLIACIKDDRESRISALFRMLADPKEKNADPVCMILCNLSRSENNLKEFSKSAIACGDRLLEAFGNVKFNECGCNLNYLGPLLSNLSGDLEFRDWLCDEEKNERGIARVATFCTYPDSIVRRGGACGTIRNICFDIQRHPLLLSDSVDILPYLLMPLIGGEEYDEEEMDALPLSLQFLPQDKQREADPDIRIILLETLLKLCVKKESREYLRKRGTYYILRELHKWETDRKALLACENVVDILIRNEEEVGLDDIADVDVPAEYIEKFVKMDEEFITSDQ